MTGTILQVSVSAGGVPKHPLAQGTLAPDGIVGDAWRYPFHGGPKRAILLVTAEGIETLIQQGFPLYHGALGENLTTRGLDRFSLRLGQRFQAGEAIVELTQVRLPCDTLSVYGTGIQAAMYDVRAQAGDSSTPVWGLSGFYASVVKPGILRPGDPIVQLA